MRPAFLGTMWKRMPADAWVTPTVYGVTWDENTDTYTRTGDLSAEPLSASPGNAKLPIHSTIRQCVANDAGEVVYFLDPTDRTKKADGTPSNLDGTDGQIMTYVPKFWSKYEFAGSTHSWSIADGPALGYAVDPAFVKNGVEVNYRLIGSYEGYIDGDGKLCSISGVLPTVDKTRAQFRTAAELRGSGWHQYDAVLHALLAKLFVIEYADFNTQAMIGDGNTAYSSFLGAGLTGYSDSDGAATANQTTVGGAAGDYMSYRGVEDWYGDIWDFVDGINIHNSSADGSRVYVCTNPADYADDTDVNYALAGLAAASDGYGSQLIVSDKAFYPKAVGGTSTTGLCDSYYTIFDGSPDSGWWVCLVGGRSNHGAGAGAFRWSSYYGSADVDTAFGGRICY